MRDNSNSASKNEKAHHEPQWREATEKEIAIAQEQKEPSVGMRYEGFEHRYIGNKAMERLLKWYNKPGHVKSTSDNNIFQILEEESYFDSHLHVFTFKKTVKEEKSYTLSAGDIVALSGDFFGVADEEGPICKGADDADCIKRFEAAYATLSQLGTAQDVEMLKKLVQEFEKEERAFLQGVLKGILPSEAIKAFEAVEQAAGRERTFAFSAIVNHENFTSRVPVLWAVWSQYLALLRYNFDHFGDDAKITFKAGFNAAVKQIKKAAQEADVEIKASTLFKGITQLLFACHFLTDLFASGHMRTPRRALHHYVRQFAPLTPNPRCDYVSGMLSHEMHDEDNEEGLSVTSLQQYPTQWNAYGDRYYFNPENKTNGDRAIEAMVEAFKELLLIYHGDIKEPTYHYRNFIPHHDPNNREPLFEIMPNILPETISLRGDLAVPPSQERCIKWDPFELWNRLKNKHVEQIPGAMIDKDQDKLKPGEQRSLWMEFFQDVAHDYPGNEGEEKKLSYANN